MKLIQLIFLFVFCLSSGLKGQDFSQVEIKTEKLADNIYALFGAGGNIGILVGEDGVFMIDDQFAPLSDKIKAAINEISDHEVKYVVNTHFHYDHTGGNENLGDGGAIIIAHENVRKRLKTEQFIEYFKNNAPASPAGAWPEISFTRDIKFHINGEDVKVVHCPHAHTDGDAMVYFKKSNVLHMGDIYFNEMFPFVDVPNGGSINGLLKAVEKALHVSNHETVIIPGHGPISNKSELMEYYAMINTLRDRTVLAKKAGQSFEQLNLEELLKGYESIEGFIPAKDFISFIWEDLENRSKKNH
jgi:glyoxylase-like metal-dependent hydrolase (beta-lactamase superfamily II)